jgi:hypothetical protein
MVDPIAASRDFQPAMIKEGTGVRPAGFIVAKAMLLLLFSVGVAAGEKEDASGNTILDAMQGEDGAGQLEIRPASQTVSDRQRERRRASRDRARRRFIRGGAELLPHFGDYTVHEKSFSTSRFKSAHGLFTVELINHCDDWTLQEKWDLQLKDQAGKAHHSNLLYRASEGRSGDRFVFAYSNDHRGRRTDFIGDVVEVDDGYLARFREPARSDIFLPPDLVFPVTHLRQILSEARRQRGGFEAITFDGGNDFAYRAVATINQPLRDDEPGANVIATRTDLDPKTSDRLPDGRYWPVRVEYFPMDDVYAPPVFTREFLLHENGIILSFVFDYGDLQMEARLKNLDIREATSCGN